MEQILILILSLVVDVAKYLFNWFARGRQQAEEIADIDMRMDICFAMWDNALKVAMESASERKRMTARSFRNRGLNGRKLDVALLEIENEMRSEITRIETEFTTRLHELVRERAALGFPLTLEEVRRRFGLKYQLVLID